MKQRDHRRFIRYEALHLLDYIELDEAGNPGRYSMGRTIDVSLDGLKLETTYPVKTNCRLLITIGLEDDLIDLEGRTTHARPSEGRFVSGVTFAKISREDRRIIAKYVEAFHARQKAQPPASRP